MIALNLPEIKFFMNQLLCCETFDSFLLQEAVLQKDITWSFDGKINADFYSEEELEEQFLTGFSFLPFGKTRSICFDMVKGKRAPSYFKFVFLLSPDNMKRTLQTINSSFTENDIGAMFINLKFQNGQLLLTTGVSYRIFSVDKTVEHEWDRLVKMFLKNHEIVFEEL